MFDVIVVGSGPAGSAAARALSGTNLLMLDVGYEPGKRSLPSGSLYELKQQTEDLFPELIGEQGESLHNLYFDYLSPKLKSPAMRFITKNWNTLAKLEAKNFAPMLSYAKGGFANAWGAGCFRFSADELASFPFTSSTLDPWYDSLTQEIGISGASDDLQASFGSTENLQPRLRMSPAAEKFLGRYQAHRSKIQSSGFTFGAPRLAVLTQAIQGRQAVQYDCLDFFVPHLSAVYTPAYAIEKLQSEKKLDYRSGYFVESFQEKESCVTVNARRLDGQGIEQFCAKRLILAAGAINSARIVLNSFQAFDHKLPLRENPISYLPFVDPFRIGQAQSTHSFGAAQLMFVYQGPLTSDAVQGTLYDLSGTLRSDFLFDFPLAGADLLTASKFLVPAIMILQFFYADSGAQARGSMSLGQNGIMQLEYGGDEPRGKVERLLWRNLLRLGYLSAPFLFKYPTAGNCYHYAGTLPMRAHPSRFETSPEGRLAETQNVYVVDAATFSRLPAKNLTFTAMANAMRIAAQVKQQL